MEKQTYIVPSMESLNIESLDMIATSMTMEIYGTTVNTSEDGAQLGNSRRETWGNLWDE